MKRVALFVGVNKYSNGIQPLCCARNDAEELWSFFRHGAKYDWVEKLVDEQAASADAIRRKIREMVAGLTHGDLFVLYFSGHGVPYLRRQLLVLADAEHRDVCSGIRNDPPFGTVALDSLIDDTEGDFDRVFLLDMCRAPLQNGQKGVAAGFSRKDLNLLPAAPRRRKQHSLTILFSCDEKQHSVEISRTGRGLFSLALSSLVRQRMEAGRKVLLDAGFVGAMENEMAHVARDNGIDPEEQRPQLEPHGDPIILVDPYGTAPVPSVVVDCPVCGKKNRPEDTFKCRGCGRDNLCLRHQDKGNYLCHSCLARANALETLATIGSELDMMVFKNVNVGDENLDVVYSDDVTAVVCWVLSEDTVLKDLRGAVANVTRQAQALEKMESGATIIPAIVLANGRILDESHEHGLLSRSGISLVRINESVDSNLPLLHDLLKEKFSWPFPDEGDDEEGGEPEEPAAKVTGTAGNTESKPNEPRKGQAEVCRVELKPPPPASQHDKDITDLAVMCFHLDMMAFKHFSVGGEIIDLVYGGDNLAVVCKVLSEDTDRENIRDAEVAVERHAKALEKQENGAIIIPAIILMRGSIKNELEVCRRLAAQGISLLRSGEKVASELPLLQTFLESKFPALVVGGVLRGPLHWFSQDGEK